MNWELHGSDGHFEIQDMDESRRVALVRFASLEEARLMTAAPDLVEACKKALEVTGGSKHWNGGTHDFLMMMEAAVAKVEGRTP